MSVEQALEIAFKSGGSDGEHHKMWVIDQMVRALTNCPMVPETATDIQGTVYHYERLGESDEYLAWVAARKGGVFGPDTYEWLEGIAP